MFPQLLFYISLLFTPFTATWSKSIPNHLRWWDFANIHGKTPRGILPVNSNYISYKMLCNWFRVNYRKYISTQQKNPRKPYGSGVSYVWTHVPSRYFNPVLSHIFYGFLSKIQWKTADLHHIFLFAWFPGTVLAPDTLVKKILFHD